MPTETAHYRLIKPLQDEYYNIDDFNRNADAIDAALHGVSDRAEAAVAGTPSLRQQIWKAAGVFSFTAPRTTRYIIECVGGGGGCSATFSSIGGDMGGGGAYARASADLSAGQVVTVTVGAAGEIVPGYEKGTAGGASSFGGFATANGGLPDVTMTSPNNLPAAGDIRLPGSPAYMDMTSGSSYATGITGGSVYGTPSVCNFGPSGYSAIGQPGAGAGTGAVSLRVDGANRPAAPGMVIVTYAG